MRNLVSKLRDSERSGQGAPRFPAVSLAALGLVAASCLALAAQGASSQAAAPNVGGSPRVPVVFVPGVTGVELREAGSAKILWGKGHNLIFPRDRGYNIARAIEAGQSRSRVEAGDVIRRLRLAGVVRKPVYQPLVELLEASGYRVGDLANPRTEDSLFLFGYDWRQSNVDSARQLLERLEQVHLARGESRTPVVLVCQSNGAQLCRYLARYGSATLQQAEAGQTEMPATLDIQKVVLMGASNGGSLRILRELDRGRKYVPWVGRRWAPEAFFGYESLYQDLPSYTDDLFVDDEGRPMPVDLYDVASWKKYQWSVFAPSVEKRLAKGRSPELFGDVTAREAFLARALRQAELVQTLLRRDSGGSTAGRYYLIRNDFSNTIARALLVEDESGWRTYFLGDDALNRFPTLLDRLGAAGDGHATLASQEWLSAPERERLSPEVMNVEGTHFDMIHDPQAQRYLLEILSEQIQEDPSPSLE